MSYGPSSAPSRPQILLHEIVRQHYPDAVLDQHVYTLGGRDRWIDIFIPTLDVAIEYMGKQWHASEEQKERDKARKEELEDLGFRVIEVSKSNVLLFICYLKDYVENGLELPKR